MAIEVTDLSAGYYREPVLKNINIRVGQGRVCGLLGHNGSGKTTLMYCLNAILKPQSGAIKILGKDLHQLNRAEIAKLISIVPQSSYAAIDFPVLEMVLMGSAARMRFWASPGPKEKEKAYEVLEEVGISELAKAQYNELSGGQKQLVLLARALYQNTPLMLLDEPNSHLDFCKQHKIMQLMNIVVKTRGVTALVTLHDPNLALYYCDEVIMMKNGRIIAEGPAQMTINDNNLREALGSNIKIEETSAGLQVVVPCNCGEYLSARDGNKQWEDAKHAV